MTDPVNPAPAEGTTTPAATPVAAPAAPVPTPTPAPSEPSYMKDRLERERRAVLKELGIKVKKGEDPAPKVQEFQEKRRVLKEKIGAQEATISRLSASEAAVKVFAETEFAALTPEQQNLVKTTAGDDPAERLRVIAIMKATAPKTAPSPATPAPLPAPANTAPAAPAPPAATSATPDVKAEYARLRESNPLLAAAYLLQNSRSFVKS